LAHALFLELADRFGKAALLFKLPLPGGHPRLSFATMELGEPAYLRSLGLFILTVLEGGLYNLRLALALLFEGAHGIGQAVIFLLLALLALGLAPLPFLLGQAPGLGKLSFLQLLLLERDLLDDLVALAFLFGPLIGDEGAGRVVLRRQSHQPKRRQRPGDQDAKAKNDKYALAGHNRSCPQSSYQLNDLY
jgi:hypothetical protein